MVVHQIVILGAGPAGISTATEAIKRGFKAEDILILEKFGEIAHMISSKYPDEKPVLANYKNKIAETTSGLKISDMTKKDFMSFMQEVVNDHNLKIQYHQNVEKITKLKNGQLLVHTSTTTFLANSVFVAIGTMSAPRSLGVPVADGVLNKVHYDIQKIAIDSKKVLVVGGGDSSAEYAKILHDRGHDVSLSYRGNTFTKMIESNQQSIMQLIDEGSIKFYPSTNVQSVEDSKGHPYVHFRELSHGEQFDAIVTALGTEKPSNYLGSLGIKMIHEGNELYSESSLDGVFFVGDLASTKGGTINIAFSSGVKAIAQACSFYLDCKY